MTDEIDDSTLKNDNRKHTFEFSTVPRFSTGGWSHPPNVLSIIQNKCSLAFSGSTSMSDIYQDDLISPHILKKSGNIVILLIYVFYWELYDTVPLRYWPYSTNCVFIYQKSTQIYVSIEVRMRYEILVFLARTCRIFTPVPVPWSKKFHFCRFAPSIFWNVFTWRT